MWVGVVFFFDDAATTEIYTLSLHDALPILFERNYKNPDQLLQLINDLQSLAAEHAEIPALFKIGRAHV